MAETTSHHHHGGPPLLRLAGLKTSQLPPTSATADELRPFVTALLREAVPFIDTVAPRAADFSDPADPAPPASNTLWRSRGTKPQPGSDARVEVSERKVVVGPGSNLATASSSLNNGAEGGGGGKEKKVKGGETSTDLWVCRRSVHADRAARGSASWAEFVDCIRDRHAETEDAFTPAVLAHRRAAAWNVGGGGDGDHHQQQQQQQQQQPPIEAGGLYWGRLSLSVVEMKHKVPPPLKPRVFPVLQLIASAVPGGDGARQKGQDEFVVVSVTVGDFAEGAMKDAAGLSSSSGDKKKKKGVVVGSYASVERVRRLPGGEVEWIMATASDAKGVLPLWVQTKAIPGQVVKDVGLFLQWIAKEREGGKGKGRAASSPAAAAAAPAQTAEGQ